MLPVAHPAQLVAGLVIWCAWFVGLYAGLSLGCASMPQLRAAGVLNPLSLVLLGYTVAVTVLLGWCAVRCWRYVPAPGRRAGVERFVARVGAGVYLGGGLATLAVGLPVLILPPCP